MVLLIVDSDMAKALLPEYKNGLGAFATHKESTLIFSKILNKSINNGDNVVLPFVGRNIQKIKTLINNLHAKGYEVNLHLNEVSINTSKQRSIDRFNQSGRFVDTKYIQFLGLQPSNTY